MKKFLYLLTICQLWAFATVGYGAVIYVNPEPDITYSTNGPQTPGIDLDNDGTFDIRFRLDFQGVPGSPNTNYFYHLGGLVSGSQGIMDPVGQNSFGSYIWMILPAGTGIGPASANWQSGTGFPEPVLGYKGDGFTNDNIINQGDCFIGLKFMAGGNAHYAWMRVNLTGSTGALVPNIIKDWAYESTPDMLIAAGDVGTGSVAVTGITVNGQGGASTIGTAGGTLQMLATVTPANATYQSVTWSVQNGTGTASISATGLLTAQSDGTVTVKATAQDGSGVSGTKVITLSSATAGITAQNLLASKCFPNPVDQALTLNFEQPQTIHGIRIINMAGQEVYKDGKTKQGTSINIPTATLQAGTYLLVFEDATGRQGIEKFVKQ